MSRVLACFLAICLFLAPVSAHDWSAVVRKVNASTVRLSFPVTVFNPFTGNAQEMQAACSGFVVNRAKGYVMTASHCLNEGTTDGMTVTGATPGTPMWVVFNDEKLDVAVISAAIKKPALKPSRVGLQQGQMIGALGYGYGFKLPLFRGGYVSNVAVDVDPEIPGPWALFDTPFIGGMSGGPIFNHDGQVVGVVQMSNEVMGLWRPFSMIYAATRAYWG